MPGRADAVLSVRADTIVLSVGRGAAARRQRVPIAAPGSVPSLRAALAELAGCTGADGAGRRWRVLLAPPWLQLRALPWSDALLDDDSATAFAAAQLAQAGAVVAADDLVTIDPMPPLGAERSAAWVPAAVCTALQAAAQACGARLQGLWALPLVAAAWAGQAAGRTGGGPWARAAGGSAGAGCVGIWLDGALLLHGFAERQGHGRPLPLLRVEPGDATGPADAPARAEVLATLARRSALQLPALAGAAELPVLDLHQPFLHPPLQPALAPPAAAGAPALRGLPWPEGAEAVAALDAQLAAHCRGSLELWPAAARAQPGEAGTGRGRALSAPLAQPAVWLLALGLGAVAAVLAAAALQPVAPVAPTVAAAAPRPALPAPPRAALAAARQAVQQIDLPLAPLLRTLSPPPGLEVRLVALDLSRPEPGAGRGAPGAAALLRLTAEADTVTSMTNYAATLASRPGVQALQVLRHQDGAAPPRGQRFVLELQWQP
jgi:hypothetical protein